MNNFINSIFPCLNFSRMVLAVILVFFALPIFAQSIDVPSAQKEKSFVPRQSDRELSDRGLQCWEFSLKYWDDAFISGPFGGDWVKAGKLRKNCDSEFMTSSPKFIESKVKISNVPNETSKQNSTNDGVPIGDYIGNKFWHWIVIFAICCFPYIGYAQRLN